jgi:hypothetical protein
MAEEVAPNEGATGGVWATDAAAAAQSGEGPPPGVGPTGAGAPINQGATGNAPRAGGGESPLSVPKADDPFAQRPEVFVGAAFAGGFVLAQILRRLGR